MTDTTTTQTAVDATNTPAGPGAAVNDAQNNGDELDTLLKEYDTTTAPPAAAKPAQPEQNTGADAISRPAPDQDVAEVKRYIFKQDMDKTVKSIRGDLSPEYFDDSLVKAWIEAQADADPRLGLAWANRHSNPKQFEKVVGTLGRQFSKQYGKFPDKQATEDRDAVTAAVRGASTRAPVGQAPNYGKLSDNDFQAEKDKLFG